MVSGASFVGTVNESRKCIDSRFARIILVLAGWLMATGCGGGNESNAVDVTANAVGVTANAVSEIATPTLEPALGSTTETTVKEQKVDPDRIVLQAPGIKPVDLTDYFAAWNEAFDESNNGRCNPDDVEANSTRDAVLGNEWAKAWEASGNDFEIPEDYRFGTCYVDKMLPMMLGEGVQQSNIKHERVEGDKDYGYFNDQLDFGDNPAGTIFTNPIGANPMFPGSETIETIKPGESYCVVRFPGLLIRGVNNRDEGMTPEDSVTYQDLSVDKIGYKLSIDQQDYSGDPADLDTTRVYRIPGIFGTFKEEDDGIVSLKADEYSSTPAIYASRFIGTDPDQQMYDDLPIWFGYQSIWSGNCEDGE